MLRRIILLLSLSFFPLFGATTTTTVEVNGYGVSRDEALQNALIEALKQTKGVSIDSQKAFAKKLKQTNASVDGQNSRSMRVDSLSQSAVKEATKGLVNSYRILSSRKLSSHEWEVRAVVKILKFKSPGLSTKNRRKIAIMPFYYAQESFLIDNKRYSGVKLSLLLNQALTSDITQSRRFAVVDRTYVQDMANELGLIASKHTPLSQKVKLGNMLGADYLLVGTIQAADMHTDVSSNRLLGTTSSKRTAEFIVEYRIIVVGTSQIKWSDTAKAVIDLGSSQSTQMALQNAIEKVTASIANALLENIYPIRVIDNTDGQNIVLNQGGKTLHVGDKLDVMRLGKKMFDPYTKEPLGRLERKVATIEIVRVNPKISFGRVVEGKASAIKRNDICRRVKFASSSDSSAQADNPNWRKSSVEVKDGGGVTLPFD